MKKTIEAKVRPLANPGLEKASLLGAARLFVSKDSLISLTGSLERKACLVERIEGESPLRREAELCVLSDKNVSPNVVMMSRAFQDATGFRIGDQIRLSLAETDTTDAGEVVVKDVAEDEPKNTRPEAWEHAIEITLERAEQVFPGMVFEVVMAKVKRTFKIVSVDSQQHNLARFKFFSTSVHLLKPGEDGPQADGPVAAESGGPLVITGVPGLTHQIKTINNWLKAFCRPFYTGLGRTSCGMVIHGGKGTGKTFILRHLADTKWGKVHWIRGSDKLSTVREIFKQAQTQQPCMILIDSLNELIPSDRTNRDAVIEAIGDELDALSAKARAQDALPRVVVVAICRDYLTDVPEKLQTRERFYRNIALPIPRGSERLEILKYYNPSIRPEEKESCLASIAQKTHAYNGEDLAKLLENASVMAEEKLDEDGMDPEAAGPRFLTIQDMERARQVTRPTAMLDINLNPPTIHWEDVGGQETVKKELSRMIKRIKDPKPSKVRRNPPKGILLYGPPGCSKTLSAQAVATESNFNFFAVKGAELLNMYVGESERAVRTLFERARNASPSIIFFDEIDSIGGQRSSGPGAAAKSTGSVNMLTTLLNEMDGFESLSGVLILAATNRPEAMDPALLRPGRFDQIHYVGPPDEAARDAIFRVRLRGINVSSDIDIPRLAIESDGHSGAEITAICDRAGAIAEDRAELDESEAEVRMDDLLAAIRRQPKNITSEMVRDYDKWSQKFKKL